MSIASADLCFAGIPTEGELISLDEIGMVALLSDFGLSTIGRGATDTSALATTSSLYEYCGSELVPYIRPTYQKFWSSALPASHQMLVTILST